MEIIANAIIFRNNYRAGESIICKLYSSNMFKATLSDSGPTKSNCHIVIYYHIYTGTCADVEVVVAVNSQLCMRMTLSISYYFEAVSSYNKRRILSRRLTFAFRQLKSANTT